MESNIAGESGGTISGQGAREVDTVMDESKFSGGKDIEASEATVAVIADRKNLG